MKKVIFDPTEIQTVNVSEVDSEKTYGCKTSACKLILMKVNGGYFWVRLEELFEAGLEAESWDPIYDCFEDAFEEDGTEYFEFESYKEAAQWFSSDE